MSPSSKLIADPEALSESFLPRRVLFRDPQIRDIELCLQPLMRKYAPGHAWLFGTAGSGKTSTARHVVQKVTKATTVRGVYVNCWEHSTLHGGIEKIIRSLGSPSAVQQDTAGKIERLAILVRDRLVVVILDEVDKLDSRERNGTLYHLVSLGRVSVLCVSHSKKGLLSLEERVLSRLQPAQIHFPSYTEGELLDLLRARASLVFHKDCWDPQLTKSIAARAGGDARSAIHLLKYAANKAGAENAARVGVQHLAGALSSIEELRQSTAFKRLTQHHRLIFEIVKKSSGILSGDLWKQYTSRCKKSGIRPWSTGLTWSTGLRSCVPG